MVVTGWIKKLWATGMAMGIVAWLHHLPWHAGTEKGLHSLCRQNSASLALWKNDIIMSLADTGANICTMQWTVLHNVACLH